MDQVIGGQVLVGVEKGVNPAQVSKIAEAVGAKVERRVASWGVYLFSFDRSQSVSEIIARLETQPGVRYAQPNVRVPVSSIGNLTDPSILAAAAGANVVVAVIDTGVDLSNPAFSGSIYTNTHEIAGNGIDDDGNGLVDDVHGWNFYDGNNNPTGSAGDGAHGTMVAGRVLQGAEGQGVSILPIQVGPGPWLDLDAIVSGIDYAVSQGARVINMSFGASWPYPVLTDAIQYAASKGVILVAAAGNSGSILPSWPAAYPGVVSVAASNAAGQKTWWSNYGGTVDFTAPGENVTTTNWGGGTAVVSGTSFSSPFVAGVIARIWAALPSLTPDQVIQKLQSFTKDVYSVNNPFYRGLLGYGLVDDQVAQNVSQALPLDGSGGGGSQQPPQSDPDKRAQLENQLAAAQQEVDRLQASLSQAEAALSAASQAVADANQAVKDANNALNQAWKDLIASWQAWYRSFFITDPAQREALRKQREAAWDNLYKALAANRDALAQLRVAQAQWIQAQNTRNSVAAQLKLAQQKVQDIQKQLDQLSLSVQGQAQTSAHNAEVQQLLLQLNALTQSLGKSGLPEGLSVQEVPELVVSGSRDDGSSNSK